MTIVWEDDVTQLDAEHMNLLEQTARRGVANGYAALGADGLVPPAQLPAIPPLVITDADIPASITRDAELAAGLATKADTAAVAAAVAGKVDSNSALPAAASLLTNRYLVGDAQPGFTISGGGTLGWGVGGATAPDVTLFRRGTDGALRLQAGTVSVQALAADGSVYAVGSVSANEGAADEVAIGTVLGQPGIEFGQVPNNLHLYRHAAVDTLGTNAPNLVVNESGAFPVTIGGASGGILFGPDTSLARAAANSLRTPGNFTAGLDVLVRAGTATQSWIGDVGGGKAGIVLGSAQDVKLYRNAAGILRTDGTLDANALTINGVPVGTGGADATKVDKDSVVVAATRVIASKLLVGDAQPAFFLGGDGKIQWGAGGAAALDTSLYRASVGRVQTDGALQAVGDVVSHFNTATQIILSGSGRPQINFGIPADAVLYRSAAGILKTDGHLDTMGSIRMAQDDVSKLWFGSAFDTNLYRSAANVLTTGGQFYSGSYIAAAQGLAAQVTIGPIGPGSEPGLGLGSAGDTSLYRAGANQLQTGGHFEVSGNINLSGAASRLFFTGDTYLYRSAAGILKTDGKFQTTGDVTVGANLFIGALWVQIGAADSGGAGYRMLRVSN